MHYMDPNEIIQVCNNGEGALSQFKAPPNYIDQESIDTNKGNLDTQEDEVTTKLFNQLPNFVEETNERDHITMAKVDIEKKEGVIKSQTLILNINKIKNNF